MLTIENYKKIKSKWFGKWQVGKVAEMNEVYAFEFRNKQGEIIVMAISRVAEHNFDDELKKYKIALSSAKTNEMIEDIIYLEVIEDMDLFGEAVSHYLNTI